MKIEFKKAEPIHSDILGKLNKKLIGDEGHSNPMTVDDLIERMFNFLSNKYSAYFILTDSQVAGYCLFRDDIDYIYIRQLFVEKDKRNQGLGKACVRWLKDTHWTDRKIRIEVLSGNLDGIEFWRRIGFHDYCITMEM
jgi:ribosomal protein S18 acetylase RimI-like enzyme